MRLPAALLLVAAAAAAQDSIADRYLAQERAAFGHFETEDWERAVAAFERQIAIFRDNPRPFYNIACCYARQGDADRAGTWMALAVLHGWRDLEWFEADPDFASVRGTEAYAAAVRLVRDALRRDPPAMPGHVDPATTAPADDVTTITWPSLLEERILREQERLHMEHQLRRKLFDVYDRRMARLARYIAENGDAKDAHEAGHERVRTALLYLSRAGAGEDDADLRLVAAVTVANTAEEFLRGWPGSPLLPDVLYWRAFALGTLDDHRGDAAVLLRGLLADFPDFRFGNEARAELCSLLVREGLRDELVREFARIEAAADRDPSLRARLTEARLVAKGMPAPDRLDPSGALAAALKDWRGPVCYACVVRGDEASEEALADLRTREGVRTVVLALDPPSRTTDEELRPWLERHAVGLTVVPRGANLVEMLWLSEVPTLIYVRDGVVQSVGRTTD